MSRERLALGASGEAAAAAWYEARGYEVLARNWRDPGGELDLVVRRGRLVAFCEVKTRATWLVGSPAEAVGRAKQLRIRRLAARWLAASRVRASDVRFDVATVVGTDVDVIEGAF